MTDLTRPAQSIAKAAMQAWADVSGLRFVNGSQGFGSIDIWLDDRRSESADTNFGGNFGGGSAYQARINISEDWVSDEPISLNSYWFQTYVHEIGHALGLGHAGNYNGEAELSDRISSADNWQASVMSYFDQSSTPRDDGAFAYLATVMPADILAIQKLYGTNVSTRTGDTVYGANSNVGGYLGRLFAAHFDFEKAGRFVDLDNPLAFTVFDTDGNDTLDFSTMRSNQQIDLNQFAASDVGGVRGSMLIGPNTVIENAIGGRGRDVITGNNADNRLSGRSGDDRLRGRTGDDTLDGGRGDDLLDGGSGRDTARYLGGDDVRIDLSRQGAQSTGHGRDRLISVEDARTGRGDDRLTGSDAANRLDAGPGRDRLSGAAGDDRLLGGSGADRLRGGTGDDRLLGQTGNDTLTGGRGADILTGGKGADTFVFAAGRDLVTDFAMGIDRIVLSASLWSGGALKAAAVLRDYGMPMADSYTLDFGEGNRLTLAGLTDPTNLAASITII